MVESTQEFVVPFAFKKVFSPEECTSLVRTFKSYDRNKSGDIDAKEFRQVCKDLGHGDITDDKIEELFKRVDKNSDGVINWEEFLTMMMSVF